MGTNARLGVQRNVETRYLFNADQHRRITNVSRWGNGDVEVGLKSIDELPYIRGLVRQSYERQMGDGGQQ
jgi:predicted transport protein